MDRETLEKYVADGRLNASPQGRLTIYNYSNATVYERQWDDVTMACRGLVVDADGNILARPFVKFFNVGERPDTMPEALPAEVPEVARKYDGSLIIVFWNPDTGAWHAITRGSWSSEQARWANEWLKDRQDRFRSGHTYLFEFVAPWNRIVVTYSKEDMVLLGYVENSTGKASTYEEAREYAIANGLTPLEYWKKPVSEILEETKSTQARNEEGYVVRFANGLRVKMKYAEYVRLHKILTGLSVKGIWERLRDGNVKPPDGMPDEFIKWYDEQALILTRQFFEIHQSVGELWQMAPRNADRKTFALWAKEQGEYAPLLFSLLDGKDTAPAIWKMIRPKGGGGVFVEDEA